MPLRTGGSQGQAAVRPRRGTIMRRILHLFGLLILAIVLNAAYSITKEIHHERQTINQELKAKIEIANALLGNEVDKLRIIARFVDEQGQKIADYLDYDNLNPIAAMIHAIGLKNGVALLLLFDEKGNLLVSSQTGTNTPEKKRYQVLVAGRKAQTGFERVPLDLLKAQLPQATLPSADGTVLCFKSTVTILHDTGERYGYVVLLNPVNGNHGLARRMARITGTGIFIKDLSPRVIFSSHKNAALDFPLAGTFRSGGSLYMIASREIRDLSGAPAGYLGVALDAEPLLLLTHRRQLIISIILPFFVSVGISIVLFFLLKLRVFNKIGQMIAALHHVTEGEKNLDIRLEVAAGKDEKKSADELENMAVDFNRMMDKLEDTYQRMLAAQDAVERANRELEGRVRERTRELEKIHANLLREMAAHQLDLEERLNLEMRLSQVQKMEALGTLAGGVAHDLNNILTSLVMYPDLILALAPPGEAPWKTYLETVRESAEKAAVIVQDLLTLARRGVEMKGEAINLNDVILHYRQSPECEILTKRHPKVRISLDLDPGLPCVLGSSIHLHKVLMNLVTNAAEAMPHGGGLRIATSGRTLDKPGGDYEIIEKGEYAVLDVADDGVGIPPEDIKHIFEPFFTTKKMGDSGSGLGTAVVWGTVKDHGGYIDIHSEPGRGTTFSVYFPVTRQSPTAACAPESRKSLAGNAESVLVVDELREQREVVVGMLRALGYEAEAVADGREALACLADHRMDVLVIDISLSIGGEGVDFYKDVLERYPGQRAILTGSDPESVWVRKAQELGAGTFLKKPYLIDDIGRAVRAALAGKTSHATDAS